MKKSRFSEEQIIGFIKEAEAGMPVAGLCRKHGLRLRLGDVTITKCGHIVVVTGCRRRNSRRCTGRTKMEQHNRAAK